MNELPYSHVYKNDTDRPCACTVGERPHPSTYISSQCPGCLAFAGATAIHDPTVIVETIEGHRLTILERFRELCDDLNPMRVHFEREVERRGIA